MDTDAAIVWDSEALHSKDDRESWPAYREHAAISLACVLDVRTGLPTFYGCEDQGDYSIVALAARLQSAPAVISYNGEGYDNVVLSSLLKHPIRLRSSIDLYARIKQALGGEQWGRGSWTLDRVAKDILGVGKTGVEGAFAPSLWADRRIGELVTYLYRDVWLTWKVWEFGRTHGFVKDPLGGKLEVEW